MRSSAMDDDPFLDFYAKSPFVDDTIAFIYLVIAEVSIQTLVYEGQDLNAWVFFGFYGDYAYNWLPINMLIWFYNFLLMRYVVEVAFDGHIKDPRVRAALRFAFLALTYGLYVTQNFHDLDSLGSLSLIAGPSGGYYLLWGLYHLLDMIAPGTAVG